MPTLKDYTRKLARLKSTRKMTKTMKMVAANKLRRAQAAERHVTAFRGQLTARLAQLGVPLDPERFPLLAAPRAVRRVLILVCTSDRGLCAGFNNNLNRLVLEQLSAYRETGVAVDLVFAGRRGHQFFRTRGHDGQAFNLASATPAFAQTMLVGATLRQAFLAQRCDEVWLAFNTFRSVLTQIPALERLLPLDTAALPGAAGETPPAVADLILQPSPTAVLEVLLPWIVNLRIHHALVNTAVGEQAARMTAMDNATRNADSLIAKYTLLRNRARQSTITRELIEIVAGAEALK